MQGSPQLLRRRIHYSCFWPPGSRGTRLHRSISRQLVTCTSLQGVCGPANPETGNGPQGDKKGRGQAAELSPMTPSHLGSHDQVMLWAAFCVAFFGFLWCSEFTVPAQMEYDPDTHLSLTDIAIDNKKYPLRVYINTKQSKTDPFWQRVQIMPRKDGQEHLPKQPTLTILSHKRRALGTIVHPSRGQLPDTSAFCFTAVWDITERRNGPQELLRHIAFVLGRPPRLRRVKSPMFILRR